MGLNGLGYLEMRGLGVEKDIEAAVRHFERAADQGSSEGKYNVGVVALAGLDSQKQGRDFRRALLHFATAAASGHVLASHVRLAEGVEWGESKVKAISGKTNLSDANALE